MLKQSDILGGVYGLAVGDALGVPVEFLSRDILQNDPVINVRGYGSHAQPVGTWSDDTSMVLATMDALCAGGLSFGYIMQCFVSWYKNANYTAGGKVFDIGGTTYRAINNFLMGEPPELCGEDDIYSNGNGSLMRMLPLIYYIYLKYGVEISQAPIDLIYSVSSLTHAHMISKVCCVYYVYAGIYILQYAEILGLQKALIAGIKAVDRYYGADNFMPMETCLISIGNPLKIMIEGDTDEIKSTGYVVDTLEASFWCLYNTASYKDAVLKAVNLGGDTDTIGAITGSLAGLYYGLEGIPKEWVKDMRNKELINSICNRFYEQYK